MSDEKKKSHKINVTRKQRRHANYKSNLLNRLSLCRSRARFEGDEYPPELQFRSRKDRIEKLERLHGRS